MNNQVKFIIILFFGFTLVHIFPFSFVDAAKLESGVMINATSKMETEKICDDTIDNDNDGKIDADDSDCAAAPATPTAGACGLKILSGVPINYGQVNPGQVSEEKQVKITNVGTAKARIMVKGGDWIGGTSANPIQMGVPEITRVSDIQGLGHGAKFPFT